MADPLSLASFWAGFRVTAGSRFYLPGTRQNSRTADGGVLTAVLGASLWRGDVTAYPGSRSALIKLQVQVEALDQAGDPFLAHAYPCAPAYDPGGTIVSAASPVLHSIASDNRRIRISGLPEGYRLARGEMLAFPYGSNPVRYAMHRIVSATVQASSAGQTPLFEVTPHIRPGATIGAAVTLYKPAFKAVIVPGSIQWPQLGDLTLSFQIIQTLR